MSLFCSKLYNGYPLTQIKSQSRKMTYQSMSFGPLCPFCSATLFFSPVLKYIKYTSASESLYVLFPLASSRVSDDVQSRSRWCFHLTTLLKILMSTSYPTQAFLIPAYPTLRGFTKNTYHLFTYYLLHTFIYCRFPPLECKIHKSRAFHSLLHLQYPKKLPDYNMLLKSTCSVNKWEEGYKGRRQDKMGNAFNDFC